MASYRKIYLIGGAVLVIGVAALAFIKFFPLFQPAPIAEIVADSVAIDSTKLKAIEKPVFKFGIQVNGLAVSENTVKRNQRFNDLLEGTYIDKKILNQLTLLPNSIFNFKKITSSKKYTVISETDSAKTAVALIYEPDPVEYVVFRFKDTLIVESHQREIITEEKTVTGVISTSLYETIDAMNISRELTNKFADVFGWKVDFQHLQRGDRFKVIYEENSVEGKPYSIGRILGGYFEHMGRSYYAFPFDQGDGTDFFDEEGNSLRKALLKYPIEFTRISSRYSYSRFHPITKVYTPHLGTDFAAATGTPIRSAGDGVVTHASYTKNNGNYVVIRHNGTYSTGYLHMSRIAVRAGAQVKQGQTIGYVGTTGLSTGPHLCYRFWKNGVQVDALRIELPPSKPLDKKHWKKYDEVMAVTALKMEATPFENGPALIVAR
ncbi:MAG TPA: peptidoglycan DD-metalloendopeptidase family protein [Cyclobacteriaceae bacterium]|nr:peptidoglycan DD-metalloendopeptidase family protein [Cyclobacteriaceae bacterium]